MLDILIRGNSREKLDTSSRRCRCRCRCRRRHCRLRSPRSILLLPAPLPLPSLENPLGEPRIPSDGPLPDVSPYHLHLYRDSTVILLPCLFAHLRATPGIPRPAGRGYKWKFRFLRRPLVYPRESTAQIYRKNLYVSSYVSPSLRVLSSDKRTGRRP